MANPAGRSADSGLAIGERYVIEATVHPDHISSALDGRPANRARQVSPWRDDLQHARQLQKSGDLKNALHLCERLLRRNPAVIELWSATAEVLLELDDVDGSLDCLRQALLIDADDPAIRAALKKIQLQSESRQTPEAEEQANQHFAKGKIAEDHEDYDTAFAHYRQANDLVPVRFDGDAHQRWVDQTCELWTPEFLNARASWGNETTTPIFIVGMPHSGTTLVEQILSAHSQVQACGERTTLGEQITALGNAVGCGTETISTARRCTQADVYEFAQNYLAVPHRTEQRHFTDRMGTNFLHLGWISLCFPEAKILYCQRDLRDVCLSCYFQHSAHQLPYASRLDTLGAYARESVRLMNHWHSVLPGRIINVTYEKLVESPEQEIRRLLQACNLSEEQSCFQSHLKQRSVPTASAGQVVSLPIHKTSQRRWGHYQQHLQPLFKSLGETTRLK